MNKWIIYALAKKESGGGSPSGGGDTVPNPALRLIDWEGTVFKEYSRESALALTELPDPSTLSAYANVDHELLLFQEWNWSLANIKEWIQEHNGGCLLVGAIYTTTDGQDHRGWPRSRFETDSKSINVMKKGSTYLDNYLFNDYSLLERISFPPNADDNFGIYMFSKCSNLGNLNIPKSITRIDKFSLANNNNLKHVILPNGLSSIYEDAFYRCCSLDNICLPNSITYIGNSAFQDCFNLIAIELPNNLTSLNDSVFNNCNRLKCVHIKNKVEEIKSSVFQKCSSLTDVVIDGTPVLT